MFTFYVEYIHCIAPLTGEDIGDLAWSVNIPGHPFYLLQRVTQNPPFDTALCSNFLAIESRATMYFYSNYQELLSNG